MITQQGNLVPALAADEAFALGCLFTEARITFQWDQHAKRGATIKEGAKLGGEMRRGANGRRRTCDETVDAVTALLAVGVKPMQAYQQVADEQGVGEQTIRKEYRAAKNLR